jgi:hypothetical protein
MQQMAVLDPFVDREGVHMHQPRGSRSKLKTQGATHPKKCVPRTEFHWDASIIRGEKTCFLCYQIIEISGLYDETV